jgi:hypothetical protein
MAHCRSGPALIPLEDFTIEYVRDYMGCRVRGDKYGDLLKVHQEHWRHARTGITTFVNDGGKHCIFGFTSSSRNNHCPPEVFKKRWDRLAKELSPKARKEPANKIYDLYNACSITVMHRGKRPLAKTSKKCMHQDHWKFDAAKFESPLSQRHRLLTQGTKPSVRETVQAGAASSLPQAVPAGAAAGAACGTGSPASQQGPARKRVAGRQGKVAALEASGARVAELTLKLAAEKIQAEDEKIKAAAALAKMETEMSELANEKIKADEKIKQVCMYAHAHLDMTRTVRGTLRPLDALLSTHGACVCIGTLWHTTSSPCRTLMDS